MATIVAVVTGKIVLKYCNILKSLGKGSINLPPTPSLYHSGGMNLYVRPSSPSFSFFFSFLLVYSFNCLLKFAKINQHSVAESILLLRFHTRRGHTRISSVSENS